MKKLNLTQFLFLCFILFSCQSKPEKKETKQATFEYTIQNYKLDDDEIARRKKDTLAKETTVKEEKNDSLLSKK